MKTLFLDFDGVLFNTLKEAYIVCRWAYKNIGCTEYVDENEYKKFYRYKFLVYNSWQYYYIMKLLQYDLIDEEFILKYSNLLENRDIAAENDFNKKYYSARNDLINNYYDFWDKLETPFPFFYEVMGQVTEKLYEPVIVSKKNKESIVRRLAQYGLAIPLENIYGKSELDTYQTKAEFINNYLIETKQKKAVFVDDNSNNLGPCTQYESIIPLLAGWGNIAIDEKGYSMEEISKVILDVYKK